MIQDVSEDSGASKTSEQEFCCIAAFSQPTFGFKANPSSHGSKRFVGRDRQLQCWPQEHSHVSTPEPGLCPLPQSPTDPTRPLPSSSRRLQNGWRRCLAGSLPPRTAGPAATAPGHCPHAWFQPAARGAGISPRCRAARPAWRAAPRGCSPAGCAGRTRSGTRSACPTSCGWCSCRSSSGGPGSASRSSSWACSSSSPTSVPPHLGQQVWIPIHLLSS